MDRRERPKKYARDSKPNSRPSRTNENKRSTDKKVPRDQQSVKDDRKVRRDGKISSSVNNASKERVTTEKKSSKTTTVQEKRTEKLQKLNNKDEKRDSRTKSNGELGKHDNKTNIESSKKARDVSNNRKTDVKSEKNKESVSLDQSSHKTAKADSKTKVTEAETNYDVIKQREEDMIKVVEATNEKDDNDYDYDDDDFEDYDDDFESDVDDDDEEDENESQTESNYESDESGSNESPETSNQALSDTERLRIREAMVLENSRVDSSSPAILPSSPTNTPVPSSPAGGAKDISKIRKSVKGLDFVGAQRTQAASKALSKTAQRGKDLVRLIELDTVYFDLLELKPQTEYEIYMKSFGKSESYQKYTQYNEDCLEKETFTEPSDTKTCWTQHPVESSIASAHEGEETEEDTALGRYNPLTLSRFVSISSQVVLTLLEERASRHGFTETFKTDASSKLSNNSAVYPPNQIFAGRTPIFTCPISSQMFVVCYTKCKAEALINSPGMTCSWNLNNVHEPVSVLISNSAHRCVCVSSYNHNVVFVGCEDGTVSLWDMNEPDSMHKSMQLDNRNFVVRLPTYSTSGIQVAETHNSKITSIQAVRFDQEQLQMSSFQIASLDEHGLIIIWVVLEVSDTSFSGSQTDLGLRPGGKIKLVKSAAMNVNFPQHFQDLFPEIRTYAFQQSCSDANLYFVATDKGSVVKSSRTQSLSQPMYYCDEFSVPSIVGSIDFNKFNWKYFLCGTSDGSILLYYVQRSSPLVVWDRTTRGRPVRTVQWSNFSSTIFYAMDSANKFYMWDLSVRDSTPLVIETYDQKGLLTFTELLPSAGGATTPIIVFGFKDGSLEAHQVKEEAINNQVNNITKLENYLPSVL